MVIFTIINANYSVQFVLAYSVPEGPPTGVILDNRSPHNISVQWNPPRVPNGVITRYTLYVGYENGSVDVYYASGESTSYNITNLLPFQIISVEISASTSVGEGPLTPEVEIQTAQARKIRIHDCKICT